MINELLNTFFCSFPHYSFFNHSMLRKFARLPDRRRIWHSNVENIQRPAEMNDFTHRATLTSHQRRSSTKKSAVNVASLHAHGSHVMVCAAPRRSWIPEAGRTNINTRRNEMRLLDQASLVRPVRTSLALLPMELIGVCVVVDAITEWTEFAFLVTQTASVTQVVRSIVQLTSSP